MSATVKMAETHAKDTFLVAAQLSAVDEDSSVAEVTTAWPSEKPGKQVKLWTMYPCPHCDKVLGLAVNFPFKGTNRLVSQEDGKYTNVNKRCV